MQTTHIADILLASHGVNHTATSKEHQGFEKCMGEYMKNSRHIITRT